MNVTGKFGRMHLCRMVHSVHCIVKIHIIVKEASYASAILIKKTAPILNGWPLGGVCVCVCVCVSVCVLVTATLPNPTSRCDVSGFIHRVVCSPLLGH